MNVCLLKIINSSDSVSVLWICGSVSPAFVLYKEWENGMGKLKGEKGPPKAFGMGPPGCLIRPCPRPFTAWGYYRFIPARRLPVPNGIDLCPNVFAVTFAQTWVLQSLYYTTDKRIIQVAGDVSMSQERIMLVVEKKPDFFRQRTQLVTTSEK